MRIVSTLPWIALTWLAGCSFDFKGLGEGGAGSTTAVQSSVASLANTGPATSTTGASTTEQSAGSTNPTSASSASAGGAGGAPGDLLPCGGFMDSFDTINAAQWVNLSPSVASGSGNKITVQAGAGGIAGLRLVNGSVYTECYTSIKVVNAANDDTSVIAIGVSGLNTPAAPPMNAPFVAASYLGKTNNSSTVFDAPANSKSIDVPDAPTHLGIVFHGSSITYLYDDGGGWNVITSTPLEPFLTDPQPDFVFFGIVSATGGSAVFDDFNTKSISISDLN